MAIDEESFYNIVGEEINRTNIVQEMVDLYGLKLQAGETRITDFNDGSEVRGLLEVFAVPIYWMMESDNELAKIAFVETAEGEWLDKHGAKPEINLPRDAGVEATGYVTFTIPSVLTTDVTVEEGTVIVSEDTGLEYATDNEATISAGETSVTVSASCMTVGEDGNCGAGSITIIDDNYMSVNGLTVTNTSAFSDGTDYEEDDEYRERLLAYIRRDDFGSLPYYHELGNNVSGVHDVLLVDDDNSTAKVLVNGDVKPTPTTVLADVLEVFSSVENHIINQTFTVDTPSYKTVSLTVNLNVSEAIEDSEFTDVISDLFDGGASLDGFDFDGLYIGESLTKDMLYNALELFDVVDSVYATVTGESGEITEVTADENEVLKLGTITINQTVV